MLRQSLTEMPALRSYLPPPCSSWPPGSSWPRLVCCCAPAQRCAVHKQIGDSRSGLKTDGRQLCVVVRPVACVCVCAAGVQESTFTYLTLVPIAGGVAIASGGEPLFNLLGFMACIIATCCRALKSVVQVRGQTWAFGCCRAGYLSSQKQGTHTTVITAVHDRCLNTTTIQSQQLYCHAIVTFLWCCRVCVCVCCYRPCS